MMGKFKPSFVVRKYEEGRYNLERQLGPLKPGEVSFRADMIGFFKIMNEATKQQNDLITVVDERGELDIKRPKLEGELKITFKIRKEDLFKIIDQRQQMAHTMIELIGDSGITRISKK